ncbi:MAG: hypothetical protein K2X81_21940 [Candidatus Obscuribacterales bacterium]|nr:hypothetical protein [Candidatus Obscuribacterales bacterium]
MRPGKERFKASCEPSAAYVRAGNFDKRLATAFALFAFLSFASAPGGLAENAEISFSTTGNSENKTDDDDSIKWTKPIAEGNDRIFYFAEAVGGKALKKDTYDLLLGVTEVVIEKDKIIFRRSDKEELQFSADTEHGGKFFKDWEKSKHNLEAKFGNPGREFLESIEGVHVDGERILINRKGPPVLSIDMGNRKLHHAFDLKGIRFSSLGMTVDTSGKHPSLKDINGASVILNAPGLSFPVEVKEFAKLKTDKGADIKVGIKNPVPSALKAILFLPAVLRFHFFLQRKD